jgi:hypothetical protein
MNLVTLNRTNYDSLATLSKYLGKHASETLTAVGNSNILQNKSLAVFCSNKCPGNIILKTYELNAAPKSSTEMFCHELLKLRKQVYTIDDAKNMHLIEKGVPSISNMAKISFI